MYDKTRKIIHENMLMGRYILSGIRKKYREQLTKLGEAGIKKTYVFYP